MSQLTEEEEALTKIKLRFGEPDYYEETFRGLENLLDEFQALERDRGKMTDAYEVARQRFLKLLNKKRLIWEPSNADLDLNVDISRIYGRDKDEFIAIMRIQPRGFRGERLVPVGVEIVFHMLLGRVIFNHRRRIKQMSRGQHICIGPKATYSIRCPDEDQPAYLVFKVTKKTPKKKLLMIEGPKPDQGENERSHLKAIDNA